jgi:hypothetical protein
VAVLLVLDGTGGEADQHPANIAENQVSVAQDIDYWRNTLGGRRNGSILVASGLAQEINHLILHRPTVDSEGTLWALSEDGSWAYYDTDYAPTAVTPNPNDQFDPLAITTGATLHAKLFIAARTASGTLPAAPATSGVLNRLHVWDGTRLRRTGLRAPDGTPTVVDTGSGGFSGVRYYRIRYVVQDGLGAVLRRSEPSGEYTFTPSGAGAGALVTQLGLIGEGETHWEIEETDDIHIGQWYRIATVEIGTTTYTDTILLPQQVAVDVSTGVSRTLSDDIGDNELQGAYRWVVADRDRLIGAGNFSDPSKDADVEWTPVGNDESGVGNDERIPTDTGNSLSLDGEVSGPITGLAAYDGRIFAFKENRVYSLTQTGNRESAYLPQIASSTYGALPDSVVEAVDREGRAALYFVDPELGPMRLASERGFELIADHLRDKFLNEVNFDAAYRIVDAVYHPGRNQVWWNFSGLRRTARGCCVPGTILPDWGSFRWVYDVRSGGSSFHVIPRLARSMVHWQGKPLITAEGGALVRCDEDDAPDDYGNTFRAYMVTRAWELGNTWERTTVKSVMVEGRSVCVSPTQRLGCPMLPVDLTATLIRDYGVERYSKEFTLDQVETENYVIARLDNLHMSEATAIQLEIGDAANISQSPWGLYRIMMLHTGNGKNVQ